jgi:hypothetical protein
MDDVKELAIQKQAFLNSDFGQKVSEAITLMHGQHHQKAEDEKLEPWRKAYHTERAAGIAEVISWFTADVALLEQGYFDKKDS